MPSIILTERQKEIRDFIQGYRRRRGISPTQREICERFGYTSYGTVQKHLRLLIEKGVLIRAWNKRRSLLVAEDEKTSAPTRIGATNVPLMGRIAAGSPIEVFSGGETIVVPDLLTRRGENFALEVRGDSMIDEGIHDGDYVVVLKRNQARQGELVAALVAGEVTLKRFYREGDEKIRLQPSNRAMNPIVVDADSVELQGVVVGLLRKY